jgi:septum formation protein
MDRFSSRPPSKIWAGQDTLVLASASEVRRALLTEAGLAVQAIAPDSDERAIEREYLEGNGSIGGLAAVLAEAKAVSISKICGRAFCVAADQTLTIDDRLIHKPANLTDAMQLLVALEGRTHRLTTSFCVARSGKPLVVDTDCADLTMRQLDLQGITRYLEIAGPSIFLSVGGYKFEGIGINLFESVSGDYFTILGLPMLKLLAWLRKERLVEF